MAYYSVGGRQAGLVDAGGLFGGQKTRNRQFGQLVTGDWRTHNKVQIRSSSDSTKQGNKRRLTTTENNEKVTTWLVALTTTDDCQWPWITSDWFAYWGHVIVTLRAEHKICSQKAAQHSSTLV
ncbi:hypothetical protein SCAR479_11355 [Seiridium cardinale]|uniref:LAGLIDADG homing endonuclease n=1 Tax=Seiridium cardinale TaxID=138064 RepID=A0ABR2XE10_9PEZI